MFITPSFKKSLTVEQFQGNYLKFVGVSSKHLRVFLKIWSLRQSSDILGKCSETLVSTSE